MDDTYESNQEVYQSYEDGGSIENSTQFAPSIPHGYAPPREMKKLAAMAEVTSELSMSRAMLAKQSLLNLAILSHAEQVLTQIAPSGAHRYSLICDAVAYADARAIMSLKGGDRK